MAQESLKPKKVPGLIPQKDGTRAILVECPNGCISSTLLRLAQEIQSAYGATVHITTAQKLMFLGLDEAAAQEALERLDRAGLLVRKARDVSQPRVCVGRPWCKIALQETFPVGEEIVREVGREPIPPKMKIGISGCPACCSWANVMDVGFVGYKSGYKVLVGGHGGYRPRPGEEVGMVHTPREAAEVVRRAAELFRSQVPKKGRFQKVVEQLGLEAVREALGLS